MRLGGQGDVALHVALPYANDLGQTTEPLGGSGPKSERGDQSSDFAGCAETRAGTQEGPAQEWRCSAPCLILQGPVHQARGQPVRGAAPLAALSGRRGWGATHAQCLRLHRCPQGLGDSRAAGAEPAPLQVCPPLARGPPGPRPSPAQARGRSRQADGPDGAGLGGYGVLAPPTKPARCPPWGPGTGGETGSGGWAGPEHAETCRKGGSQAWPLPRPPTSSSAQGLT